MTLYFIMIGQWIGESCRSLGCVCREVFWRRIETGDPRITLLENPLPRHMALLRSPYGTHGGSASLRRGPAPARPWPGDDFPEATRGPFARRGPGRAAVFGLRVRLPHKSPCLHHSWRRFLRFRSRTLARRKKERQLVPQESDRLVRLARSFAQMVEVLGSLEKARVWSRTPNRALGGEIPLERPQIPSRRRFKSCSPDQLTS